MENDMLNMTIANVAVPAHDFDLITSLRSSGVLVDLHISCWYPSVKELGVTAEVHAAKGAREGAGEYKKKLFPGAVLIERAKSVEMKARAYHKASTEHAWSDKGMRYLLVKNLPGYIKTIGEFEAEFGEIKAEIIRTYDDILDTARANLGPLLFNPLQYPSKEELARKYSFTTARMMLPAPGSGDVRIDLAADAAREMDEHYRGLMQQMHKNFVQSQTDTLRSLLAKLADKLDFTGLGDDTKIFRDSLIENVRGWVASAYEANEAFRSPEIAQAVERVVAVLNNTSADALRHDAEHRADTRKQVNSILSSMTW